MACNYSDMKPAKKENEVGIIKALACFLHASVGKKVTVHSCLEFRGTMPHICHLIRYGLNHIFRAQYAQ